MDKSLSHKEILRALKLLRQTAIKPVNGSYLFWVSDVGEFVPMRKPFSWLKNV